MHKKSERGFENYTVKENLIVQEILTKIISGPKGKNNAEYDLCIVNICASLYSFLFSLLQKEQECHNVIFDIT